MLCQWDFVTLPEEDRATAIRNMHRKFGKDRVRGSEDMFADRQTHTHAHVLITILCRHSGGQRKNDAVWGSQEHLNPRAPQI